MHRRFIMVLRLILLFLVLAGTVVQPQSTVSALTTLTVEPLTWNVVGLDSNNVNVGPNHFPVGARVCNSGSEAATNVTAAFEWDSSDPFIDLRQGSLSSIDLGTLNGGACADAYFEVEVDRDSNAYDHTRDYHIDVTAGNVSGTITTPTPRKVYVEHLISQSRNAVTDVQLDGVSVAAGGTMTLMVGQTYEIKLVGFTATQGYEQIEYFINFPNTIFQILSVSSTFTADTSANVGPSPINRLYGDNCVWDNDPNSPTYRACLSTGKTGGNVTTTYQVRILQVPGAPLVNPQPLSTLIYDFSGSSFHYNSDYGVSTRYAHIVNAGVAKSFSPKTITPGGTSTLTFTINNPGTAAMTDANFTDDLPSGMTLANSSVTYTGCGAALPATVSDPMSFSNITVAGLGTCTIAVTVTAAGNGTYNNTSGTLFIGATNTGSTASDTLVVSSQPPPPSSCTTPSTLATWNFNGLATGTTNGPFTGTLVATNVSGATATYGAGAGTSSGIANSTSNTFPGDPNGFVNPPAQTPADSNSWGIHNGWQAAGIPTGATTPYFQFQINAINYGGVSISSLANLQGNWTNGDNWYVLTSTDETTWTQRGNGAWANTSFRNAWGTVSNNTSTPANAATTYFRVYFVGAGSKLDETVFLDNITITGCPNPSAPTIAKSFGSDALAVGANGQLTFTITNNGTNATDLSGLSFTDVLPGGLELLSPVVSNTCGGTLTLNTTTDYLDLSEGNLAAANSCTIVVTVQGGTAGSYTNTTTNITSTQTGPNTSTTPNVGFGQDTITVVATPVLAKSFTANPIFTGNSTTLDFDIANPNVSTALTGVTFTDVLPAGLSVADGTFSVCGGTNNLTTTAATRTIALLNTTTIAAGGTCSFSVTVTGSSAGSYTNTTGNISSTNGGTGNTASANVVVKTPSPAINLLKQVGSTVNGPWTSFMTANVGSNVYYRFTVENTGDVSLSNVSIADPTLSTASCSWTRGDSATPVNSPFTLAVADAGNNHIATCVLGPITAISGLHPNTATASGTSGSTVTKSSSATYGTPAITIAKSVTQTSFNAAGDVLDYSYLVTNSGNASLMGPVTVADNKTTVTCPAVTTVGDNDAWFDVGESLTCTASYTVLAADVSAGSVTNTASATVGGVTSNHDSKTVYGQTDLSITKDNGATSVNAGGTTTYTIRATNNGPSGSIGAILSDPAATGLTKTAVACSLITPGQCTVGTTPTIAQLESGTFALSALASGEFYEITVTATVNAASGTVTNTSTINPPTGGSDPNPNDNTANDTDTITPLAELSITKSNNAANGWVVSGGTFQWTITARNGATAGTAAFANGDVILSDSLPAGQTYGAVTVTNGTPAPTGTIMCSITGTTLSCVANGNVTLPADASFGVAFNVTTVGSANLANTATVDPGAKVPESNEGNNTGSNLVYVFDAQPSKLLVTTSESSTSGSRVTIGEMVRYRIVARIPEGDFANFQLVDNIPSGLQFVNDGTARFAFVSNGAGVTSSTLTCPNDTGNVFDLISLASANVDCPLMGAISGGTGNGVAVTFSLGNLSNADVDADAEYAVVEFNALVLNVNTSTDINQGIDNQTGVNNNNFRPNDAALKVNNITVGINSANVTVNIAEPAITNVSKSVSAGPYTPGSAVTYTLTFSNVSATNAATAFDIVLTDALNANLTPGAVNISSTQTDPCTGGTAFTTSNSTAGQNVTVNISCLDPGRSVTVTIDAPINAATANGTNISNTGNVIYTSLPGAQGNCSTSPFTCTGVGATGSGSGERNGSGGVGADGTVLNNYADSGTVSFAVTAASLPVATIAVNPGSVAEDGATNLVYTVTLNQAPAVDTLINLSTTGTASGSDYTGSDTSVTILAGTTSATVTIDPTTDTSVEPDETVIITIDPGTGYTVGVPSSATGTITNDDIPVATITVNPASVAEDGATNLVYTVTLDKAPSVATTVNLTTTGTALGADYTGSVTSVTILPGSTTATITIDPTADTTVEPHETVIITIDPGTGYTVGTSSSATGTITNDDIPVATITVSPVSVAEDGATNLVYTVTLDKAPLVDTTVNLTTTGTASGSDYSGSVTSVTILANTTSATVTVDPTTDTTVELAETVIITIDAGTGYTVGVPSSATGTITDDDLPVATITVNPASVLEDGTTNLVYTVTLDKAPLVDTVINLTTTGTATSGGDFTGSVTSVTILAGNTTGTVTIDPVIDTTIEPAETVIITIDAGTGYIVGVPSSATGTITNDDLPVATILVSPASVAEDGATNLVYTVSLDQAPLIDTTINLTTAGSASGSDYAGSVASVTILTGNTTATVTIDPVVDTILEPDEIVVITIDPGTGYIVGVPSSATGTITNDDLPVATITINPVSVDEDGAINLVYTVTLDQAPSVNTTINLATTGTATSGDYSGSAASVTILAGTTTATVTIDPIGDTDVEPDETVIVTIDPGTGYAVGIPSSATGTITNDDIPVATITVNPASVAEDSATNLVYTITLDKAPSVNTTINLATTGTAAAGDYTGAVASVTILAGNTTATVTVDPTADTTAEQDETVIITIGSGTGYSVGTPSSATGTITDDDLPVATITVSPASVAEDGATNLIYTVELDQAPLVDTIINLITGGTAGGTDYTGSVATVTISANTTTATVTISPTDDSFLEGSETVILTIASGTGYSVGTPSSATGTITDDDLPVATITVSPASAREDSGTALVYTVELDQAPLVDTVINLTIGGTAGGTDYTGAVASVTILANTTSATVAITPTTDTTVELNETVVISLDPGTGYSVGTPSSATGTITEIFDPPSVVKTFNDAGLPELEFRMVWINSGNIAAVGVQVTDAIPSGTTYVTGSLSCDERGSSSQVDVTTVPVPVSPMISASPVWSCGYDAANNQVQWMGTIGPDNGNLTEATAANEVVITFRVRINDSVNQVQNQASARTDVDVDSNFVEESVLGTSLTISNLVVWNRSAANTPQPSTTVLPATGFAPNVVTDLSNIRQQAYTATGDVTVEIPSLNVKLPVVGVPKKDGAWNVAWLGNQAGWLEGTAFPSWSGNSVLTGHVYQSNGLPGPFLNLGKLKYGDTVVIHAYGQKYIFEVRENKIVEPNDTSVMKHEEKSWLTLITCKEYDPATNTYRKRVVVRAVLVSVASE